MLSKKAFRRSDFNIVFIVGMFLKFGNQILFCCSGMAERAATQLPYKDTTGCVVSVVPCVDSDTFKAGYVVQQWQDTPELR